LFHFLCFLLKTRRYIINHLAIEFGKRPAENLRKGRVQIGNPAGHGKNHQGKGYKIEESPEASFRFSEGFFGSSSFCDVLKGLYNSADVPLVIEEGGCRHKQPFPLFSNVGEEGLGLIGPVDHIGFLAFSAVIVGYFFSGEIIHYKVGHYRPFRSIEGHPLPSGSDDLIGRHS